MRRSTSLDTTSPAYARRRRHRRTPPGVSFIAGAVCAVVLYAFIDAALFETYRVASASMERTLLVGDRVLANKLIYGARLPLLRVSLPELRRPRAGDVLLFQHPDDPGGIFVKRCVAVAGQEVAIRDGCLLVGGERVAEPPGVLAARDTGGDFGPVEVPPGMVFVLGDNRDHSSDSREWGFLPVDRILARAESVIWSRDPGAGPGLTVGVRWHRIGRRVR